MENRYCKYCGSEIPQNVEFCGRCGRATAGNYTPIKRYRKLTTCKSCGALVAKSAKSCPNCGAKTTGQLIGEAVTGIGCGAIAAPIVLALIAFYVIIFYILK